jgi:hypothetical protein
VYLRARYYDPGIGRFLTADNLIPDPLKSQSWNKYTYVKNNPVRYNDPSGHCADSDIECKNKAQEIESKYPNVDFDFGSESVFAVNQIWTVEELEVVEIGLDMTFEAFDRDFSKFQNTFPELSFARRSWSLVGNAGWTPWAGTSIYLYDTAFQVTALDTGKVVAHEMGHVLDNREYRQGWFGPGPWHWEFIPATGGQCSGLTTAFCINYCAGPNRYIAGSSDNQPAEDFADAFLLWTLYNNPVGAANIPEAGNANTYATYRSRIDFIESVINRY